MTGIIPVNKDKGMTSFGVVAKMRGICREKKAGHAGTLDPMATGVLPILFGGATRFLDLLPDHDKAYRARFRLGMTTDTLDIEGNITSTSEVKATEKDVLNILPSFTGDILQVPPMFSAVSKDGVRLYELARKGIEVEREKRPVTIKKLELIEAFPDENEYVIDVECSKGTYIRTLCDDIGRTLGCGAVMTELARTKALGITQDMCITLSQAQEIKDSGESFEKHIIPIEKALEEYKRIFVSPAQSVRFSNGGALDAARLKGRFSDGLYRVYSNDGVFLGVGEMDNQAGSLKVKKLLVRRD